jgi:cytochrome oxidase assembly protein ShyY1
MPRGASDWSAHTVDGVRLGFLLQPRWVALTVGVILFATACFTLLAPWQFRRHHEKRTLNAAVSNSFEVPPAPIETVPPDTPPWRQVVLTGSYLAEAEVVARLRSVQGEPAFEVLTPMRLTSGGTVLVDRGFLRPGHGRGAGARGNQVPDYPAPPAGIVTVVGRLRHDENDPERRQPLTDGGRRQVYAINAGTVATLTSLDGLRPGYVQLNAEQPGVLGALPLPRLDAGPYLSYALQWLAFGTMALVGWVLLARRELRELAERAPPNA